MDEGSILLTAAALLLNASEPHTRAIQIPRGRFNLMGQTDTMCEFHFRLGKAEIELLVALLEIPDPMITPHRYNASAVEALCILLNRLAWPHRLGTMVLLFGRSREALSVLSNGVMCHIYDRFKHLLRWDKDRLDASWMEKCASAIHDSGAPLDCCIGFIDGTVRGICRPGKGVQKTAYNGHKRKHALKFQSITTPDGIIVHLYGPEPGSRHDAYFLERSGILAILSDVLVTDTKRYVIYGDPAYGANDVTVCGYKGARLDQYQSAFNSRMSAVRIMQVVKNCGGKPSVCSLLLLLF
ncbi:hypothetical protein H257_07642 [Aphanomyces astaci]|uniref:DDE Tnp4 domain-containing protein n=1 Tax=Aphanomyces astaci TaxID=112090 RepID=W4GGJ0_APHAT|nr:hypothetical protein H257_07642 [Aphanomyces astaci]ETV78812.1 hypothetical protein H257_07642 [Aphanomyces astaci]|eukprot:XP_009831531.1 hypothetical protein H257_07642 [Aphanomyces astaci]